jgi:hypothetical protein
MPVKPLVNAEWAVNDIQQLIDINGDQIDEVLNNKIEPTAAWKLSGQLYQENLPYPYFNYQFDLIDKWLQHLDQRQVVGDIYTTLTANNPTASSVSAQLGGTWVTAGTDTIGTAAVSVFVKTV